MVKYVLGDINFNSYLEYKTLSQDATDILVGNTKVYCVYRNLNSVYVYNKNTDGTVGAYLYTRNWMNEDGVIADICANGSSVPYSYAVFVDGGTDYLVGWGVNTRIVVWEISATGSVTASKRQIYSGQERTLAGYSRAGWDGGDYIWFWDNSTHRVFKWDLTTRERAEYVITTSEDYGMNSSYTGSGLIVDNDYIYWGSGANQNNPIIGAFRLADGVGVGNLTNVQFKSLDNPVGTSQALPTAATLQISPLHPKIAYIISSSFPGVYVVNIESAIGNIGFDGKPKIVVDFQQGVEYYATDDIDLAWEPMQLLPERQKPEGATVTATSNGVGGLTYEDGKLFRAVINKDKVITDIELGGV